MIMLIVRGVLRQWPVTTGTPSPWNTTTRTTGVCMSETRVKELEEAIKRYLDEFYEFDLYGERIQWPRELADLIGWVEPS
jgi:hypothetical protein